MEIYNNLHESLQVHVNRMHMKHNVFPEMIMYQKSKSPLCLNCAYHGFPCLNCAYFGIPCIGNIKVDTQRYCHPELSVAVDDVQKARKLAYRLKNDKEFYDKCSERSKKLYRKHYDIKIWKKEMNNILL